MLELLPAPNLDLLPAMPGFRNPFAQLSADGTFLNLYFSTTQETGEPIELGAASVWCDDCGMETIPVPLSDPSHGWIIFPCHQGECECCYSVGRVCHYCRRVEEDCCVCEWCSNCGENAEDICNECDSGVNCCCPNVHCDNCGQNVSHEPCDCFVCESCGDMENGTHEYAPCSNGCGDCNACCSCEEREDKQDAPYGYDYCECGCGVLIRNIYYARKSRNSSATPWQIRGDKEPENVPCDVTELTTPDRMLVDPRRAMATFYICDWIMAMTSQVGSMFNRPSILSDDRRMRNANLLFVDAKRVQDSIVSLCDRTFQDYVFCAIGGELRHHRNICGRLPSGRSSAWDYFYAMGELNGRENLTQDCVDIFGDGQWSGSYGGKKWKIIAETLLLRIRGDLDAKTFVDRVFSLQHNGGSLLNKMEWKDCSWDGCASCVDIGNAHASERIDWGVLAYWSDDDALSLLTRALRVLPGIDEREGQRIGLALESCLTVNRRSWVAEVPSDVSERALQARHDRWQTQSAREALQVRLLRHRYWHDDLGRGAWCDCGCAGKRYPTELRSLMLVAGSR